jgi:hypothetical protein
MRRRRAEEVEAEHGHLRRDWVLGLEEFRQETTMSLKWIAQRLEMGSWTYASNLLRQEPQSPTQQCLLPLCQK